MSENARVTIVRNGGYFKIKRRGTQKPFTRLNTFRKFLSKFKLRDGIVVRAEK